uniref:Uncharacterized protein n=1 Tax=Chromera velia TaxID=505693 RepID=D9IXK4_9ALVE|nr:hypothetical protein CHVEC_pgp044 [Chromera velia]ADJ66532.1 hypothetical protein [Chromera velia]
MFIGKIKNLEIKKFSLVKWYKHRMVTKSLILHTPAYKTVRKSTSWKFVRVGDLCLFGSLETIGRKNLQQFYGMVLKRRITSEGLRLFLLLYASRGYLLPHIKSVVLGTPKLRLLHQGFNYRYKNSKFIRRQLKEL